MNLTIEYIFHKFYSPLCNYASRILKNETLAEDIVQSIFIQLHEKNNLSSIENIERYLLRCVRFKCIDHFRERKRISHLPISENEVEAVNVPTEITEDEIEPLFYYYAAKLPPKTREVFLMNRVNKLTYKEIAEELNISQKTVENQIGSALKKIRTLLLKDHYFLLSI